MKYEDKLNELEKFRNKIDEIDSQIFSLLDERLKISEDIAEIKKSSGLPVFDALREKDKIKDISESSTLDVRRANINIYKILSEESKNRQNEIIEKGRYGLIGRGLEHSISPEVHRMLGVVNYELLDINDLEELKELKEILYDKSFLGFNVTSPYKREVIKYLDEISYEASLVNAVNTIKRTKDGRLIGYNTDIYGFEKLARISSPADKNILILGSGGGAMASCIGMRNLKAKKIILASRNPLRAKDRVAGLADEIISYDEISKYEDIDIIINATRIGMYPYNGRTPFDIQGKKVPTFEKLSWAIDLIYNPYRTRFLLIYKDYGKKIISGLPMLVWQAIRTEEIWERLPEDIDKEHLAEIIIARCLLNNLNITFIGMPGSGKSSISRRLAGIMGREFIDIDRLAEKEMGTSIADVINDENLGEEYFRKIETSVLARECKEAGKVIATGGGSIIRRVNRNCIRENSIVIYMKRPLKLITTKNRPISIREGVLNIYKKRAKMYENTADILIFNDRRFGGIGLGGRSKAYNKDINTFAAELREIIEAEIKNMARDISGD